jgi:hypothetical protein
VPPPRGARRIRPRRERAHALGRTALWFLGFAAVAAAASLVLVAVRGRTERRNADSRPPVTTPAEAKASPTPAWTLEDIGPFPSPRVVYDPQVPDRLHSGGEVSEDGGRTWRPLVGDDGWRIVPLGGSRGLAPALGPDGAVLYGEVLFDAPSVPRGLGPIAHGAEWRDGRWNPYLSADRGDGWAPDEPSWRVASAAYVRGQPTLASENQLLVCRGPVLSAPVHVTALLAASDGATWVATRDPGRFPMYVDADGTGSWRPVAGAAYPVVALAEGGGGICAAGSHLGRRGADGTWQWATLPNRRFQGLAAHPRLPLVAAWARDLLVLSRDAAARPRPVPLGDVDIAWAAWDPARDDSLTLLDRRGFARRLSVAALP